MHRFVVVLALAMLAAPAYAAENAETCPANGVGTKRACEATRSAAPIAIHAVPVSPSRSDGQHAHIVMTGIGPGSSSTAHSFDLDNIDSR